MEPEQSLYDRAGMRKQKQRATASQESRAKKRVIEWERSDAYRESLVVTGKVKSTNYGGQTAGIGCWGGPMSILLLCCSMHTWPSTGHWPVCRLQQAIALPYIHTYIQTNKQTYIHTHKQTNKQTNKCKLTALLRHSATSVICGDTRDYCWALVSFSARTHLPVRNGLVIKVKFLGFIPKIQNFPGGACPQTPLKKRASAC